MTNPNNEPAFPYAFEHQDASGFNPGMSLRDYFAAHALTGLISRSTDVYRKLAASDATISQVEQALTEWLPTAAYSYADAMLEARKK